MRKSFSLVPIGLLLMSTAWLMISAPSPIAAKNIQQTQSRVAPLTNQDVIELLQAKLTPDEMIAKIRSSPANFDTSDAGLRALKDAGLPDAVIAAMMQVEKAGMMGPAANADPLERPGLEGQQPQKPQQIVVPAGTRLDVEAVYTVSSLDVRPGDLISFRVLVPIKVGGCTVIENGALVTARVVVAKRGGHWGHGGRLSWTMQDVVAVDGTRLPIRPEGETGSDELSKTPGGEGTGKRSEGAGTNNSVKGTSHSGEVLTKVIIAGAIFPPLAPLGLMQGFKRGENAVLPEGKRFLAFVGSNASVTVSSKR